MQTKKLFAALSFMIIAATAQAQNEKDRIKQGVKSGELTRTETARLIHQQKNINQEIREAKSDGSVTKCERKDIRQDKKQASKNIYAKKHNKKDRN